MARRMLTQLVKCIGCDDGDGLHETVTSDNEDRIPCKRAPKRMYLGLRMEVAGRSTRGAATVATTAAMLVAALPALAQELDRSGFYTGGHMGYLFGNGTATLADPIGVQSSGGTTPYGTFYGGVQAGYEHFFNLRLMLGVELDM